MNQLSNKELYNSKTLFTLSGASMAVWLVTSVIASVININIDGIKWLGLAVSLFLAYLGVYNSYSKINVNLGTVAFFNGLLIFVTASGIDSINHGIAVKSNHQIEQLGIIPYTSNLSWWEPIELSNKVDSLQNQNEILNEQLVNSYNDKTELIEKIAALELKLKSQEKLISEKEIIINNNIKHIKNQRAKIEKDKRFIENQKSIIKEHSATNINNQNQEPNIIQKNGYYGLAIGKDTIVAPQYSFFNEFYVGSKLFYIISKNNLWGVLDAKGKTRIACKQRSEKYAKNAIIVSEEYRNSKKDILKGGFY